MYQHILNRINHDIKELRKAEIDTIVDDSLKVIHCILQTPKTSLYEGNKFVIRFELLDGFPFKSPSVGFSDYMFKGEKGSAVNCGGRKIYHPNVDFESGSICVDVLNSEWTPITSLSKIITDIVPFLLNYPNPDSPLNSSAAKDYRAYSDIVKKYMKQFGNEFEKALDRATLALAVGDKLEKSTITVEGEDGEDGEESDEGEEKKQELCESEEFKRAVNEVINHSYRTKIRQFCVKYAFKGKSFDEPFEVIKEDEDTETGETLEERLKREQEEADYAYALSLQDED